MSISFSGIVLIFEQIHIFCVHDRWLGFSSSKHGSSCLLRRRVSDRNPRMMGRTKCSITDYIGMFVFQAKITSSKCFPLSSSTRMLEKWKKNTFIGTVFSQSSNALCFIGEATEHVAHPCRWLWVTAFSTKFVNNLYAQVIEEKTISFAFHLLCLLLWKISRVRAHQAGDQLALTPVLFVGDAKGHW